MFTSNEFNDALAVAVPVVRERSSAQSLAPGTIQIGSTNRNTGPSFEINITSSTEKTPAQLAAEREKKNAQAEQNALPVWHTQSTVSGDLTTLGRKEAAAKLANGQHEYIVKEEEEKKKNAEEQDGVQQSGIFLFSPSSLSFSTPSPP